MKSAITDTVAYVKDMAQNMAGLDLRCVALSILMDMAIPINYSGFAYLREAVLMHYENPMLDLANETYLVIGTKYGGYDSDTVATDIRSATRVAWFQRDAEKWSIYLPALNPGKNKPPTNAELIAGLARILELYQGCAEAYLRQQNKEVVGNGSE